MEFVTEGAFGQQGKGLLKQRKKGLLPWNCRGQKHMGKGRGQEERLQIAFPVDAVPGAVDQGWPDQDVRHQRRLSIRAAIGVRYASVDENSLSRMEEKGPGRLGVDKNGDGPFCDPDGLQFLMPVPGPGILCVLIPVQITGTGKAGVSVLYRLLLHLVEKAGIFHNGLWILHVLLPFDLGVIVIL